MLSYLYNSLESFRKVFSRHRTWIIFIMIIIGFIGSSEMLGVSSFCRFWLMETRGYYSLSDFFRPSAWESDVLLVHWFVFVLSQNLALVSQGYLVAFGDHTYVPKEGRRMPGVVTLHQESETRSKPSYFKGQCRGVLALGVGNFSNPFALPPRLQMHQGFAHLSQEADQNAPGLPQQMVMMAMEFAPRANRSVLSVSDAYFSVASVFRLAHSVCLISVKAPLAEVIVRAKKNYVAYFHDPSNYLGIGSSCEYGEAIHLMEVSDHLCLFQKVRACIYGQTEEIFLLHSDLMWKPTKGSVCFVFAKTSHGAVVLMCSNPNQDPVAAIGLYCLRTRIGIMFGMLRQLLHIFRCHFGSEKMLRHSRKPKKNKMLRSPKIEDMETVRACRNASERFADLGGIALGMLRLIALLFSEQIRNRFQSFLRTRSRQIPSERTTKAVMGCRYTIS